MLAEALPRSNLILEATGKWLGSARPPAVKSKWGAGSDLKPAGKLSPPLRDESPARAGERNPTHAQNAIKGAVAGQQVIGSQQPQKEHESAEDLADRPLIVKLCYNVDKDWVFTDFYFNNAATLEQGDDAGRAGLNDLHSGYKAPGSFYLPGAAGPAYNWRKSTTFYALSPINDTNKRNLLDTDLPPGAPASPRSDSPTLPRTPSPTAKPSSPMWTSTTASSPTSSTAAAAARFKSDFSSASSSEEASIFSDPASDPTSDPASERAPSIPKCPVAEPPLAPGAPDSAAALQSWVDSAAAPQDLNPAGPQDAVDANQSAPGGLRRKRVSFATLASVTEQATAEGAATPPASPPSPAAPGPAPTAAAAAAAVPAADKAPVARSARQARLDSISARIAAITADLDLRLGATPPDSAEPAAAASRPPRAGMRALTASPLLEAQTGPEPAAPQPLSPATRAPSAGHASPSPGFSSATSASPAHHASSAAATTSPTVHAGSPAFAASPTPHAASPATAAAPTAAASGCAPSFAAAAASSATAARAAATAATNTSSDRSKPPAPASRESWTTNEDRHKAAAAVPNLPQYHQHQYGAMPAPPPAAPQQQAPEPAAARQQASRQQPAAAARQQASRQQPAPQPQQQQRAALAAPMSAAAAAAARSQPLTVEQSGQSVTQMVVRSSASVTVRDMEYRSLKENGYEPAKGFWSWFMWNRTATVKRKRGYVPPSVLGIERAMLQKREPEPEVEARSACSVLTGRH